MAMRFFAMRVHLAPKVELGDAVFLSILFGVFDGKTNLKDFYRAIKIKNEIIFENKKGDINPLYKSFRYY